jgi:hypothetical protein
MHGFDGLPRYGPVKSSNVSTDRADDCRGSAVGTFIGKIPGSEDGTAAAMRGKRFPIAG